ncbi:MAG: homocysteine S-methyltransferase family protein [Planctomycetes bacterium]|nr:homocysteine S-methyltransferase family protein [Planctomycetota bacterium]
MAQKKGDFLKRLKAGEILLSDCAWGTELNKLGLEAGANPDEWNVTHPDKVKILVQRCCEAGSDMVLTNTFNGTRFRQKHYGKADEVKAFNEAGARCSKEAAGPLGVFVTASVGPTGEFVEPLGLVSEEEMYEAFKEQIEALKSGGADAVVIETIFALEEMKLGIKAAKDCGMFTMATMTFDPGAFGFKTMMGVSVEQATKGMEEFGADVIGTNCGNGIENMVQIVREMRSFTQKPILCHSNAGIPKLVKGEIVYQETPELMAARVKDLVEAGANIVGGCCGTTPEHIKLFRAEIDKINRK